MLTTTKDASISRERFYLANAQQLRDPTTPDSGQLKLIQGMGSSKVISPSVATLVAWDSAPSGFFRYPLDQTMGPSLYKHIVPRIWWVSGLGSAEANRVGQIGRGLEQKLLAPFVTAWQLLHSVLFCVAFLNVNTFSTIFWVCKKWIVSMHAAIVTSYGSVHVLYNYYYTLCHYTLCNYTLCNYTLCNYTLCNYTITYWYCKFIIIQITLNI